MIRLRGTGTSWIVSVKGEDEVELLMVEMFERVGEEDGHSRPRSIEDTLGTFIAYWRSSGFVRLKGFLKKQQ